ncbi:hypothetical protein DERF_008189 [Dermatophagoides farinae]|uniref:Uncharacterized protein n=1 Tax=Dermatophagoides farinae TaxID=6954 RepID=A0A922I3V4_DERFA|nr:hypothetical protein DERF_008189 [Dermatophagoides farinae]
MAAQVAYEIHYINFKKKQIFTKQSIPAITNDYTAKLNIIQFKIKQKIASIPVPIEHEDDHPPTNHFVRSIMTPIEEE